MQQLSFIRAAFKTHLKWNLLTFSRKYKKFFVSEIFFLVIIQNYFRLENSIFSEKCNNFFFDKVKEIFSSRVKNWFFGYKKFFGDKFLLFWVGLGEMARSLHFALLSFQGSLFLVMSLSALLQRSAVQFKVKCIYFINMPCI